MGLPEMIFMLLVPVLACLSLGMFGVLEGVIAV